MPICFHRYAYLLKRYDVLILPRCHSFVASRYFSYLDKLLSILRLAIRFSGAPARTNRAVQAVQKFLPSRRGRGAVILPSNDFHTSLKPTPHLALPTKFATRNGGNGFHFHSSSQSIGWPGATGLRADRGVGRPPAASFRRDSV